jgi:predicted dinucleotide-binding enzyme
MLIDATNPLTFGPGGFTLALGFDRSGGEEVARLAQGARVVKTLNTVGSGVMDKARGYPVPPAMFLAGDDEAAKAEAAGLLTDLGFSPIDAGGLKLARLLEPFGLVWINQVVTRGANPLSAFAFMQPA